MLPKSHIWKELPNNTTSPHRAFVTALREIRECSSRTQAEIAKEAHQAATTLSNHLNGGRIPDEGLLREFYAAVEREVAGREPLPHSLSHLLELRAHAQKKHCECCQVGFPAATDEQHDQEQPAFPNPQNPPGQRRALRLLRQTRRRELSALREHERVPVPLGEGDRHPAQGAELTWTETGVVARFLADGRNRDAELLLWRAGAAYPADEVLKAVAACRSAGLRDAAETILINAAGRMDRQAVLNIAAALDHAGRPEDVSFLLAAAQAPEAAGVARSRPGG
ncbi:hypothetical protein ACFCZ5_13490 [Streptomyces microflavus]|uniref:hypothetical protein n=1 Tax=Streptomyces microflavus TaxID=1919 RepID=UPI0035DC245E